jgi:hypothetical protein
MGDFDFRTFISRLEIKRWSTSQKSEGVRGGVGPRV